MKARYCHIIAIMLLLTTGCSTNQLERGEYLEWVKDPENGLITLRELREFNYRAEYQPLDYYILQQNKEMNTLQHLDSIRGDYGGFQYWKLEITVDGVEDDILRYNLSHDDEYYARVKYFSFDIQNDVYLEVGTQKLPCLLNHFERTYGLSPKVSIMLVFPAVPKEQNAEKYALVFRDNAFNNGTIKLVVEGENIKNIPSLTL